jgi:salicylate hydroxylase
MLPFNAQGGNQALEDGGALFALFSNLQSKDSIPERLRLFDQVRRKRANRQQIYSSVPTEEVKNITEKLKEYASEGPPDISRDESMRESILREMGYVSGMEESRTVY